MAYVIRQNSTGLYLNSGWHWVPLERARVFKQKSALKCFLDCHNVVHYVKPSPIMGLPYWLFKDKSYTMYVETDFSVVEVEVKLTIKEKT